LPALPLAGETLLLLPVLIAWNGGLDAVTKPAVCILNRSHHHAELNRANARSLEGVGAFEAYSPTDPEKESYRWTG
jgi:hypothetical protein